MITSLLSNSALSSWLNTDFETQFPVSFRCGLIFSNKLSDWLGAKNMLSFRSDPFHLVKIANHIREKLKVYLYIQSTFFVNSKFTSFNDTDNLPVTKQIRHNVRTW